ncbi:MAG: toll/interleukin-1 receptor domain-containing protein [Phormidesmis sp.]
MNNSKDGIFISYAQADQSYAEALVKELEFSGNHIHGWNCGESIAGSDWEGEIQKALRETSVVLLITSKDSLISQYVNYEIGSAIAADTPVIPVLVDDVDSLPTYLRRIHAVDVRGLDRERMGAEVAAAIKE